MVVRRTRTPRAPRVARSSRKSAGSKNSVIGQTKGPIKKWVQVKRLLGQGFSVDTWVAVNQLRPKEREEYEAKMSRDGADNSSPMDVEGGADTTQAAASANANMVASVPTINSEESVETVTGSLPLKVQFAPESMPLVEPKILGSPDLEPPKKRQKLEVQNSNEACEEKVAAALDFEETFAATSDIPTEALVEKNASSLIADVPIMATDTITTDDEPPAKRQRLEGTTIVHQNAPSNLDQEELAGANANQHESTTAPIHLEKAAVEPTTLPTDEPVADELE
jgi:hypothetical protein